MEFYNYVQIRDIVHLKPQRNGIKNKNNRRSPYPSSLNKRTHIYASFHSIDFWRRQQKKLFFSSSYPAERERLTVKVTRIMSYNGNIFASNSMLLMQTQTF